MLLTPIQTKILTLKISHFMPHCAKEYAKEKEKEKNMTIFHTMTSRVIND